MVSKYIWNKNLPLWLLLWPFSLIYEFTIWIIRLSFNCGWFKKWQAPCPIVIVGNITVGGSGKTPMVIWLVQQLKARGLNVGVVSRGYKGKSNYYPVLVTNETPVNQAGDEAILIVQRTQVALAVAPNRRLAIEALLDVYDLDLIIMDDGLQHYALQRDFEIIVIDGIRRFGNGWLLPSGPMRERISRLNEVDAVIINGGKRQNSEIGMTLQFGLAVNLLTGQTVPIKQLSTIIAIAGIGNPQRFFNMIKNHGITPKVEISFEDHYNYDSTELYNLTQNNESLLMTEKDAVKCRSFAYPHWWYLPVYACIYDGNKATDLLDNISKLCV
ncbi:tetraacyldisaccharide 4'-kinase [Pantoea sp. Mhis]|uniref:tetraacyldisaccharide 4'-kinase n=1 Tax=Pantoea sp. Mhis TaxID=2576759 RepID=UPI001F22EC00|nr:tetraacyldisaccharide 4'-kinase [Pantoea sp. Mhis]